MRVRGPWRVRVPRVRAAGAVRVRTVRVAVAVAVSLLVPGTTAACTGGAPAVPARLVIAAGDDEDVYRVLGEALGRAARRDWSAQVEVPRTTGSVRNLQLVAEGEADVGFATVDTAAVAITGEQPFDRALPIRALARLYDDYLQVVTLAGGGVAALADLAGRRVSIGSRGSGTDIAAQRILDTAGVTPGTELDELGAGTAARALANGELDAFFVAGGLPTPAVAELAGQPAAPVRLLSLPAGLVGDLQDQFGEYYQARSIPAGSYPGVEAEVATVSIPTVLVVRRDLPDDTAYRLTELLFRAKPELVAAHREARRLDHRSALATFPVALHPGAAHYYRDAKPLAGSAHWASR